MRQFVFFFALLFCFKLSFSQADFVGIAKYKLSVTGNPNTDSMAVVFDKERIAVILYIPDSNKVVENIFIDDFRQNRTIKLNTQNKNYEIDSLKRYMNYPFVNANALGTVKRELCFRYEARIPDSARVQTVAAECLASINFRNSFIKDYAFLGYQPVIVDSRIVMEFTTTQANGTKPKVELYDISAKENVDSYFNLDGYKNKALIAADSSRYLH